MIHIASSGGVQLYPHTYLDMIRSGFLVTGIPRNWISLPLRPSLTWKSRIQYLLHVDEGHTVGYECSYASPRKTTLAAVSCGYSDGYPHQKENCNMEVIIHGSRAKVVGRVGMNQMMVDVGNIPESKIGDEVILIGEQGGSVITADDIAKRLGSTPAIVTCSISKEVPRIYLDDNEECLPGI